MNSASKLIHAVFGRARSVAAALLIAVVIHLALLRRKRRAELRARGKGPKVPQEADIEVDGVRYTKIEAQTSKGPIAGFKSTEHNVLNFRGIPYAAPPLGSLRFKQPKDHCEWKEVRDCTRFGPRSIQYPLQSVEHLLKPGSYTVKQRLYEMLFGFGLGFSVKNPMPESDRQSEDCLTINVCTPSLTGKRPVLVYIHGGAFIVGCCQEPLFNQPWGHPITAEHDIVVVHFTYRLGALGFLKVEGGDYNCGLYDMVKALEWVNNEIHRFGGDPDNVTLMGQSAGAMSVACLMSSYAVRYFRRAILQSGAGHNTLDKHTARRVTESAAKLLGIAATDLTVDYLKYYSAQQIWTLQMQVTGTQVSLMPFQPVVDGELIPAPPVECIARGSARNVDLLCGYTLDEWGMFNRFNPIRVSLLPRQLFKYIVRRVLGPTIAPNPSLAEEYSSRILELYEETLTHEHNGKLDWDHVLARLITDTLFVAPSHVLAEAHLGSKAPSVKCFKYRFDFGSQYGAMHALDNPFFHGTVKNEVCSEDIKRFVATGGPVNPNSSQEDIEERFNQAIHLSKDITYAVAKFVEHGVPCLPDSETWPEYNVRDRPVMLLNYPVCNVKHEVSGITAENLEYCIGLRKGHLHGFGRMHFLDDDETKQDVPEHDLRTRVAHKILTSPRKPARSIFAA